MCVCVCVCDCVKWLQPFKPLTNTSSPFFPGLQVVAVAAAVAVVVIGGEWRGGVGLYVLLMPIGIHQQSLQLQCLIAASWGTEQSWPRKDYCLGGILWLFMIFLSPPTPTNTRSLWPERVCTCVCVCVKKTWNEVHECTCLPSRAETIKSIGIKLTSSYFDNW